MEPTRPGGARLPAAWRRHAPWLAGFVVLVLLSLVLLREPLGTILRRIPLSERIYDATVLHTGPYAPSLQMACALENDDASVIRRLCEEHEMDLEEVNRALLRVLSDLEVERPAPPR